MPEEAAKTGEEATQSRRECDTVVPGAGLPSGAPNRTATNEDVGEAGTLTPPVDLADQRREGNPASGMTTPTEVSPNDAPSEATTGSPEIIGVRRKCLLRHVWVEFGVRSDRCPFCGYFVGDDQ